MDGPPESRRGSVFSADSPRLTSGDVGEVRRQHPRLGSLEVTEEDHQYDDSGSNGEHEGPEDKAALCGLVADSAAHGRRRFRGGIKG